jgi:hypothetical protein
LWGNREIIKAHKTQSLCIGLKKKIVLQAFVTIAAQKQPVQERGAEMGGVRCIQVRSSVHRVFLEICHGLRLISRWNGLGVPRGQAGRPLAETEDSGVWYFSGICF